MDTKRLHKRIWEGNEWQRLGSVSLKENGIAERWQADEENKRIWRISWLLSEA